MSNCISCVYYALVLRVYQTYGCTLNGCDGKSRYEPREGWQERYTTEYEVREFTKRVNKIRKG
jgi:hypothetical protein